MFYHSSRLFVGFFHIRIKFLTLWPKYSIFSHILLDRHVIQKYGFLQNKCLLQKSTSKLVLLIRERYLKKILSLHFPPLLLKIVWAKVDAPTPLVTTSILFQPVSLTSMSISLHLLAWCAPH